VKTTIEVKDRKEGEHIRTGLEDPAVRAFVVIMGVLKTLPTDRSRARVLTYVNDLLSEDEQDGHDKSTLDR
jgi:hypothetical protein